MGSAAGDLSLRSAEASDAAAIARIHVESWRDTYASILAPDYLAGPIEKDRLALWVARLEHPPSDQIVIVAEESNGRIVGFVCAHRDHDAIWGSWIDNIHVMPSMRGQGIGELLLSSVAALLTRQGSRTGLYLSVFEANMAALHFYQRLGGRVVGRLRSCIPAAEGKIILRVHWPTAEAVRRRDC